MKLQIKYYLRILLYLPILPWLSWKGKQVRATVPRKREASGPKTGNYPGGNEIFRVLLMGESHVAGMGISAHKVGLAGQFAKALSPLIGKTVAWNVIAKSGYKAEDVTKYLVPQLENLQMEMILIGLGGNDSFKLTSPLKWKLDIRKLISSIRKLQPDVPIYFANLPPVGDFPAFTPLMQKFLNGQRELLRKSLISEVNGFHNVYFFNDVFHLQDWITFSNEKLSPSDFFSDGVHPSVKTYEIWGSILAEKAAVDFSHELNLLP